MWDSFIKNAQDSGHTVYCVTMRYHHEMADVYRNLEGKVDKIIYTSRKGKANYVARAGFRIDVWIDDTPSFILMDAAG
jgi:hypothetical protein